MVRLYVDGHEVGSGTGSTGAIGYGTSFNSGGLLFGDFADNGSAANFNGLIDEIKLYNTALSAKQISNNSFQGVLIVNQPQDQLLNVGIKSQFTVTAQGAPPLSYQWMDNGINLAGATKQILTILDPQSSQVGNSNYSVVVSCATMRFTNGVPGLPGQALVCNQSSLIRVHNNPAFETQNFSVQAYVRSSGPGTYKYMMAKPADNLYGLAYGLYSGASGGLTWFVLLPDESGTPAFVTANVDATNVWDGNWHQITGTWDGEFVNLYVDGVLMQSVDSFGGTIGYGQGILNGDFIIGDYSSPPSGLGFIGNIANVKYFDHALAAGDVMDSFSNPNGFGATNGLVSWYQMNGNAIDALDKNDGVIVPNFGYEQSLSATFYLPPPSFSNVSLVSNLFSASLQGPTGKDYVIQFSTDLSSWQPLITNTVPFVFTDTVNSTQKNRFYRAVSQ